MKTKTAYILSLGFLLALVCGNLSAQNTQQTGDSVTTAAPQAATTTANRDILVVTGRIFDAGTHTAISNAKLNFDKLGDEVLQASVNEQGHYAIALDKKALGEPIRLVFKVAGYKRYVVKNLGKVKSNYVDVDVYLEPMESNEKSTAKIKYEMNDDPFNPLVIKME
ncbi:MAG: hypothetical protein U0T75_01785 [Chitinophagales bacterium]